MIIQSCRYFFILACGITVLHAQPTEIVETPPQEVVVQDCAAGIGALEKKRLSVQLERFDAEIVALCQAGDYGQARTKADAFARQMLADPAVEQWFACNHELSELVSGRVAVRMEFLQSDPQPVDMGQDVCRGLARGLSKPRQWTIWP